MKKLLVFIFLAVSIQLVRPDTVVVKNDYRAVLDAEIMREHKELWDQVCKEMNSETFQFSKIEKARIDRILRELDIDSNCVGITTFFRLDLKDSLVTVVAKSGYWFLAIDPQWFKKASDVEVKFAMGRAFLCIRNDLNHFKIDEILSAIATISSIMTGYTASITLLHYWELHNSLRYERFYEKIKINDKTLESPNLPKFLEELAKLEHSTWRQYMEKYMCKNFRRVFDISSGVAISSIALIFLKNFLDNKERILDIDVAIRYNCVQGGISFYQRLIAENKAYLVRNNYSLDDYLKKLFISKKGNNFLEKGPALTKRIEWLKAL